jgi:hypothetical protein
VNLDAKKTNNVSLPYPEEFAKFGKSMRSYSKWGGLPGLLTMGKSGNE